MTDDELAKALSKAALARALREFNEPGLSLIEFFKMLAAAMTDPTSKPTLH